MRDFSRRLNSLGQIGQPGDVANAVTFLCNPSTRGINGAVLRVCGGYFAGA
jgi:3-oxoacyl-[acyl-carrier protein] reductase